MEIVNELLVLDRTHVARPDNFCLINFGVIIYPFVKINVVIGAVPDNRKVPLW
jgi:hypothetical protein